MSTNELWLYFSENAIARRTAFGREFLWVPLDIFLNIQQEFVQSRNYFHPGKNYRSYSESWKHIHAIIQDNVVHLHVDTGNISRSWRYSIAHFWYDVLPHLRRSIVAKRYKSMFKMPSTFDEIS